VPSRRGRNGPRRLSRAERRELGFDGAEPRPARERSGHPWIAALVVLVGIVVIAGAGYVALYSLAHARIPRNTEVGGVDIGGLTAGQATTTLSRRLTPDDTVPITVVAPGLQTQVTPGAAGLTYDPALSVARTGISDSRDPRVMLRALFAQSSSLAPVVRRDAADLKTATTAIAKSYDQPVREGSVGFAGTTVQTVDPLPGRSLDPAALGVALTTAFEHQQTTVTASVATITPHTTAAAVSAAAARLARPALSGPIQLRTSTSSVVLQPDQFASALKLTAGPTGVFALGVDVAALRSAAGTALAPLDVPARSATIAVSGTKAVVVAGARGSAVTDAVLAAGVQQAALAPAGRRVAVLSRSVVLPAVTVADLDALAIHTVVGSFTAYFPDRPGFDVNIARAGAALDGAIVDPGQQLSFNTRVGERTQARGYVEGLVIANGRYGLSLGGGVSVAATALFNAAYAAGWAVPERATPGVWSQTAPAGRDATVDYGSIDLLVQDDTPSGAFVHVVVTPATPTVEGSITVELFSTPWFSVSDSISARSQVVDPGTATGSRAAGCVPSTGIPGFAVLVRRTVTRAGSVTESDARTVTYTALPTVTCD
jgi:vancomycin resistance protein YoaR